MSSKKKYDIDKLEWQQFEELSFKCLQYDISPSICFIEGGNDKGRDFEYTGVTDFFDDAFLEHKYIFQSKHKSISNGFTSLKKDLTQELEKVYIKNSFQYDTYCLVTNISITGNQYDILNKVFEQFITDNEFSFSIRFKLYSYRHFESCIDKHNSLKWIFPSIVRNTDFKFLLEEILEKNERNITSGWLSVFERNKENFIYTSVFEKALKSVKENNLLLLSGPSKSGKTYNAEMILFNSFCNDDFTPYKIDRIEEFDKFYDINKKQIFLFDDAFGKYNIDLYRADSFNRKMEYIFELISENHRCIFTSREYIFKAFIDYSESYVRNFITKIIVEVSDLSVGEKDSLFRRYYRNSLDTKFTISKSVFDSIIKHKNFSPETIRAYFANCSAFELKDFAKHLNSPDDYLEKDFNNLSEKKKIVLLSTLLSLRGNHLTISYSFDNLRNDLNEQNLISLRDELIQLEGSLLKNINGDYQFYHPSMFDFFVRYISKDISTYRKLLLKNFNIDLLNVFRFKPFSDENVIEINNTDVNLLIKGFERLINTPEISLSEINSIFTWISSPDVQLNFKILIKGEYKKFLSTLNSLIMEIDFSIYLNEDIYDLGAFFRKISLNHQEIRIDHNVFENLIQSRKDDENYWLLVFRLIPLLDEEKVFILINRDWFKSFFFELRLEIDSLGKELYGNAYPEFIEVKKYEKLLENKKLEEAIKIENKKRSDFKQKTNKNWYPRYKKCKEKINTLKSSHPYGYKLYEKLIPKFSHLQILEENQMNRYIFNKEKKWW